MAKDLYWYSVLLSGLIGISVGMLFALAMQNRLISENSVVDGIIAIIVVWFVSLYSIWEVKH